MASVYSDEYQRVINALKKARKENNITQTQLAEALGKPQSFIAKVESGERRLDMVEFVHLARMVSLDPEMLIREVIGDIKHPHPHLLPLEKGKTE
ncbi:helix-turn-helix domain-containing protein [Buttiauxella sp. A2-C1_F]|uniref:helix-turn-helix domain-containing protein n=1 Tax=unclassified Buttiauxella TaxID=2634062 RepID=UPI001E36E91D|nr:MULTISPECIES: helix-turn-helix transcriptional regulator [unclassified Buttiauxella]MCE0800752.1 helix-turn-helix domain-containing protein [Buttiauxella sp. W03-F01]MCE0847408.1 helix-turn-helix domain-containing protein [Buttiauxella sp. A2-C1_F]